MGDIRKVLELKFVQTSPLLVFLSLHQPFEYQVNDDQSNQNIYEYGGNGEPDRRVDPDFKCLGICGPDPVAVASLQPESVCSIGHVMRRYY